MILGLYRRLSASFSGWPSIFTFTGLTALASSISALLSLDLGGEGSGRGQRLEMLISLALSLATISTGSAYARSLSRAVTLIAGLALFAATLYVERGQPVNLVEQAFERRVFLANNLCSGASPSNSRYDQKEISTLARPFPN